MFFRLRLEIEVNSMRLKKTVLEAEGVNLYFSGVKILHDIHFDLEEGEVHCLLGENGA